MQTAFLLVLSALVGLAVAAPNCFNHQWETYNKTFSVMSLSTNARVTPIFSSTQIAKGIFDLISSANVSIDIAVPSWAALRKCQGPPVGSCTPEQMRLLSGDPVFMALVNAVHRGVRVRVLAGYCNTSVDAPGTIDTFSFLSLTGASVRAYATTDFVHSKYYSVDGKVAALISANWDAEGVYYNREAGVIVEDLDADAPVTAFTTSVFNYDWSVATEFPVASGFTPAEMDVIENTTAIHVPFVGWSNSTCSFSVPNPPVVATVDNVQVYTLPDAGWATLEAALNSAVTSIDAYMYVIDSFVIQDALLNIKVNKSVNVRVLTSPFVEPGPFVNYNAIYKNLTTAGIPVMQVVDCLDTHHQKFWIIDNKEVHVSTNNWASSEYPINQTSWPVGSSADRGLTMVFKDAVLVDWFGMVLEGDWERSVPWPRATPPPGPPPPPPMFY